MTGPSTPTELQPWIRVWFALDAIVFLFPPIYWVTNSIKTDIFGIPSNLLYFILGCTCVTGSVVAAYAFDPAGREPGL